MCYQLPLSLWYPVLFWNWNFPFLLSKHNLFHSFVIQPYPQDIKPSERKRKNVYKRNNERLMFSYFSLLPTLSSCRLRVGTLLGKKLKCAQQMWMMNFMNRDFGEISFSGLVNNVAELFFNGLLLLLIHIIPFSHVLRCDKRTLRPMKCLSVDFHTLIDPFFQPQKL